MSSFRGQDFGLIYQAVHGDSLMVNLCPRISPMTLVGPVMCRFDVTIPATASIAGARVGEGTLRGAAGAGEVLFWRVRNTPDAGFWNCLAVGQTCIAQASPIARISPDLRPGAAPSFLQAVIY